MLPKCFFCLSLYIFSDWQFQTPLPSPLKWERQFACLRKRLIDNVLQYFNKTFEDSQDADKLVLPALGGDRGGR